MSRNTSGNPPPPASAEGKAPPTPSRRKRQYLPAEERRQQILAAAQEVFARSGLKGARTRELAQAAGINQATLFEHFKSKEELFLAAVLSPLEEILEGASERGRTYARAESLEQLLQLLQPGMQERLETMVEIFPLLVQGLFSDRELGQSLYRDKIVPMLEAHAERVGGRLKPSVDSRLVQLASFGMFFAIAMDQNFMGKADDLSDISRQLTSLIVSGSTQDGSFEQ